MVNEKIEQVALEIKDIHIPKKANIDCAICHQPAYAKITFIDLKIKPTWFCRNCFSRNFKKKIIK